MYTPLTLFNGRRRHLYLSSLIDEIYFYDSFLYMVLQVLCCGVAKQVQISCSAIPSTMPVPWEALIPFGELHTSFLNFHLDPIYSS